MFEALFGNRNIQKILLFLFVNNKCYGSQLQLLLKSPLTPLQKALHRLEKGGIITSSYEGKTRLFQFNPSFPLLFELQQLLKKAYTLLPPQEKKSFSVISHHPLRFQTAERCWEQLSQIKGFTLEVHDHKQFTRKGQGEVTVQRETPSTLIFYEKGVWEEQKMEFTNTYRWTFDRREGLISLEHLRQGLNHPVFLFHLTASQKNALSSIDSHLCGGDLYFGQLHLNPHGLHLKWRVIGEKKDQEIELTYRNCA